MVRRPQRNCSSGSCGLKVAELVATGRFQLCVLVCPAILTPSLLQVQLTCVYVCALAAAFLLASYLVLAEDVAPEQAALPLLRITPSPFLPYRDASDARSDFGLNILDCLKGLARGARKGWFDWRTFDVEAFDAAAELGFSIVCPKFVALQSPYTGDDAPAWARVPDVYVRAFNCTKLGVRAVVRLCSPDTYPHKAFEEHSIAVHDLDLHNASVPSADITKQFFRLVKQSEGAIAVHCRAGLGRTGTLVALWLMFQYDWKARETIAWLRLVRPGSVIGEQQHFLTVVEAALGPGGSGLTSAFRSWRRFEEQRAASVGGSRGVDARGLAAMVAQEAMQRRISKMGQNAGSPSANGSNGSPGRRSWGSPAGSVGRRQSCSASPQGVAWSPSPGSSPLSAASPLLSREQRGHALQGIGRSERRLIRELSALLEGPDEDLDSAAAEAAAAHRRERQQAASPRPGSGAAARLARGRSLIEFRVLSARAQRSQSRDASSRGSCDSPVATGGRGADAEGASEAGGGTGDADGGAPWPSSWWSTLASRGEGRPSLPTSGVMG